jgi:hypothetical protein
MMHSGHPLLLRRFIDFCLLNQRIGCEMLDSKKQQTRDCSRQKSDGCELAKTVQCNPLMAGKAVGVSCVVSGVVRPREGRESDEVQDHEANRKSGERGPSRRGCQGPRAWNRNCYCGLHCSFTFRCWSLTRTAEQFKELVATGIANFAVAELGDGRCHNRARACIAISPRA